MKEDDQIYDYVIVESKKSVRRQMQREIFFTLSFVIRNKAYFLWRCYRKGYRMYTLIYCMFVYRKIVWVCLWYYMSRSGMFLGSKRI